MKLLTLEGKWVDRTIEPIDWNAPCLSKFQDRVKKFLKNYWSGSNHVVEEFKIPGTRLRVDMIQFGKRVCIEMDGAQHYSLSFYHGGDSKKLDDQLLRDQIKELWIEKNKMRLIRVYEDTILTKENFDKLFTPSIL